MRINYLRKVCPAHLFSLGKTCLHFSFGVCIFYKIYEMLSILLFKIIRCGYLLHVESHSVT